MNTSRACVKGVLAASALALAVAIAGPAVPALLQAQSPPAAQPGQVRPGAPASPSGARQARPTPAVGTGRIAGRVVSTDGRPLRGASLSAYSAPLHQSWGARCAADGAFEIADLPAGEFELRAMKPGYVTLSYGAKKGGQPGRRLRLAEGQKMEKVDFQLPRACVLTGIVYDEYGEPAGEASVEPLKMMAIEGKRRLMPTPGGNRTDDLGRFRIYGLDPGEYFVRASLQTAFGSISDDRSAHAASYYPGVTALAEATTVACRAGQEASNIQLTLARVATVTVSGQVVDSQGKPIRAGVSLMQPDEVALGTSISSFSRPDGAFVLSKVPPGTYQLIGRTLGGNPMEREMASVEVSIGARDISGLVLPLSRGATVRGRVVSADKDAPFDFPLNSIRIGAAIEFGTVSIVGRGMSTVNEDGTFEVTGLLGNKRLQVRGLPDTWMLKAIRGRNGDVTDQRLAFAAGETLDGFEVVLTNRVTMVTGTATDERSRPVADFAVGIFSDDPAQWGPGLGRVMAVRSDQDGRYQVKGLQPGRYLAVAMTELNVEEFADSEYLERLRPLATPLTLAEGETKTLDLKLTGGL